MKCCCEGLTKKCCREIGLPKFTEITIKDEEGFQKVLEEIRQQFPKKPEGGQYAHAVARYLKKHHGIRQKTRMFFSRVSKL